MQGDCLILLPGPTGQKTADHMGAQVGERVSRTWSFIRSPILIWGVRLALGGLFMWAGVVKFIRLDDFATVILVYDIVPENLVALPAIGLPALEILSGLATILGFRKGYWAALVLLVLFLGILWLGILQDLSVDCGCFSLSEQAEHATLKEAFVRDWFLLAGVIFLLLAHRKERSD